MFLWFFSTLVYLVKWQNDELLLDDSALREFQILYTSYIRPLFICVGKFNECIFMMALRQNKSTTIPVVCFLFSLMWKGKAKRKIYMYFKWQSNHWEFFSKDERHISFRVYRVYKTSSIHHLAIENMYAFWHFLM